MAIILWNQLLLYPAGVQSDELQYAARLKLPAGWSAMTALPKTGTGTDVIQFRPVSLTTLIDSPVLCGVHVRTIELGGSPAAFLHLAADSETALAMTEATQGQLRKLRTGSQRALRCDPLENFLWTLSDRIAYEGIEHHESSDNRTAERVLIDDEMRATTAVTMLLPHEYVHSWNGKNRARQGLTGNYYAAMRGDLLWVYEGLTEYLGMVLSARSGLASPEEARVGWAISPH